MDTKRHAGRALVLTAPSPHVDRWQRLSLAHGDQDATKPGASSVTDGPEVPVEQLSCPVNGAHDVADRDELCDVISKVPILVNHVLQKRQR